MSNNQNSQVEIEVMAAELGMRNITSETLSYTPINQQRSHKTKQKSHNFIEALVSWLFVPIAWFLSLGVAFITNLMALVNLICGLGFMAWSLFLSIENYYMLFNRGILVNAIAKIFDLWTLTSVFLAVILGLWVEKSQSDGWKELTKARKQASTIGRVGINGGAIALFVIATAAEAIALIFGFATRGGLNVWNVILILVALFGYKLGSSMTAKFGGAK